MTCLGGPPSRGYPHPPSAAVGTGASSAIRRQRDDEYDEQKETQTNSGEHLMTAAHTRQLQGLDNLSLPQ